MSPIAYGEGAVCLSEDEKDDSEAIGNGEGKERGLAEKKPTVVASLASPQKLNQPSYPVFKVRNLGLAIA